MRGFNPVVTGVRGTRATFDFGDATSGGERPAVIVTVRATAVGLRQFSRACHQRGLYVRECRPGAVPYPPTPDAVAESIAQTGSAALELIGGIADLEYMTGHPSVVAWHEIYATVGTASVRGAGNTKK